MGLEIKQTKQRKFTYLIDGNSIRLNVDGEHLIRYQKNFLKDFNKEDSKRIAENLIYLLTLPQSIENFKLEYQKRPFFENLINKGILNDIPRVADQVNLDTKDLISAFNKKEITFEDNNPSVLSFNNENNQGSVTLSVSFGKDSLLSFGLAKELGFDTNLVFFNDTEEVNNIEYRNKRNLIKKFVKELEEKVIFVYDNTDKIFKKRTKLIEEFTMTNAMLSYTLELLPIATHFKSKYLLFGNEQNLNDSFINKDGFIAYPSYDQTSEYTEDTNVSLKDFGGGFEVISLVEPIYHISEYKILKNRYSKLLKYMMSCSGSEGSVCCYNCPTCAKTFLYSSAVGINPKKILFKKNFFNNDFKDFYPLFAKPVRAFEKPPAVRDEQLYAFYLSYKNGAKGYLINLFKEKYLKEAKEREEELYKKFFGIHKSSTLPNWLKKKVINIYKEELNK